MPAFSYRHVKNLYPILWRRATEMVRAIEQEATTSPTIITRDWASRCALDIVGEAGMGYDFGALKNPQNDKLLQIYKKLFSPPTQNVLMFMQMGFFFLDPEWLLNLPIEMNRKRKENTAYIRNTVEEVIKNKKKTSGGEGEGKVDIISLAINDKSGIFQQEDLVNLMMNMLAAGHETSASALQFLVWALGKHPAMQARLREEVRSKLPAITVDDLSLDAQEPQPWSAELVDSLPYLNAVVMEVLRMYPPAPTVGRKALEDVVILGTLVPKGTDIVIAAPLFNTNPELWGPDAHVFNPERWMGVNQSKNGGAKSPVAFMTFIQGPRTCIGNQFSKSELLVIAAAFVGRFKFELLHPERELEVALSVTMSPKDGAEVKVEIVEGW
jgi:cytochrome P450